MTKVGSGQVVRGEVGSKGQSRSLLTEFLDALALEGRSPHSVNSYRRDLEPLLAALPARLDQVHPADLREFFRAQQQAGRAPSSINHAIAATRSFFNFLVDNRMLDASPAMSLRSIRVGPSLAPKHLTVEEVDRLLAEPQLENGAGVRDLALLVNRYLRRIGVTDRSGPHLLRHTFATHALRARPNLRAVQELLGHSSVTTTQRYTHMDADDLRQQVAELPGNGCGH